MNSKIKHIIKNTSILIVSATITLGLLFGSCLLSIYTGTVLPFLIILMVFTSCAFFWIELALYYFFIYNKLN